MLRGALVVLGVLARNEGTRPAKFWFILLKRCA
jgi:hypothetical protein